MREKSSSPVPTLREHRLRRGMTQAELARTAGFSERALRLAEAGRPVRPHTQEVLAEALSTAELPVTPADLRGDPLAVVQAYYAIRREHSFGFARHCAHLLHPEYRVIAHGDPAFVPYAGTYRGVEGLDTLYRKVAFHYRPLGEEARFFTSGNRVMATRRGRTQPLRDARGRPYDPLPPAIDLCILQEWTVRDGKIVLDELHNDALVLGKALDTVATKSGEDRVVAT
ncbi:MAG: helix-turn-helix transcriptional regulator [Planctomycetota bacterium]